MKALAIIALVFAAISMIVPVMGIFIAMFCSMLALISFRSEVTLSAVTFGLNILSTAFLSPSLMLADAVSTSSSESGALFGGYVLFHVVLLALAIAWRLLRGRPGPRTTGDSGDAPKGDGRSAPKT